MGAIGVNINSTQIPFLFIMCLALIIPTSTATLTGNETDQLALLAFKANIVYDPQEAFKSWNSSLHFCNWEGIGCGKRNKRVTTLNLTTRGLVGRLSPDIGNMSFLREIILYNNNLEGVIPTEVDRLFRLKILNLERNVFEGSLPETLGRLNRLVVLQLSSNKLSGVIHASVFNHSSLSVFSLANNQLDGSLPSDFGLAFPNLQEIQLSYNKFTGSIPLSLSNASELQAIEMQFNSFSGNIAVDFGRLPHLQKLHLENNNLRFGEHGALSFFDLLINCTSLKILELGANNFEGSLPRSIGNLSATLIMLSLADNHFSGSIPPEICKIINLILLSAEDNMFTGIIPSEIVKLGKLQRLVLSNNRLTGNIPASLGNLSIMDQIKLENNELMGTIPPSFGSCPMLVHLDLSQNNLSGRVPNKLFDISPFSIMLNLSRNHLAGSLPAEIGVLRTLGGLDVSENEFSGLIPDELGSCTSLESLYIQGNFIQGDIPQSLRALKGLQNVDFSRNNLSGTIPHFLETLSLKYSNLSWNDFKGDVPLKGVFTNASAFSIAGNKRLCGGIPELQLRRCNVDGSHKHKASRVLAPILIGSAPLTLIITCISIICIGRKKSSISESDISKKPPFKLSYTHIHQATDGFSVTNLISEGDIGLVYKGKLGAGYTGIPDGQAVAVKVLKPQNEEIDNIFINEFEALINVRHRNIIKIIGTCSSIVGKNKFKAIIYEFMDHGRLDMWLYPEDGLKIPEKLNLSTRIDIAVDVASALDYLHNQSETPLIHCNLTPKNILLDKDMTAHIANFKWAKSPESRRSSENSSLRGTYGYVPPEYCFASSPSTKGDVYNYGIIILEMLTGKNPIDPMFYDDFKLQNLARNAVPDRVMEIIDPVNLNELVRGDAAQMADCLSILFNIGLNCTVELPQLRPDIGDVLSMLETVQIIFKANSGYTEADINKTTQFAVLRAQSNMKKLLRTIKKDSELRSRSMLPPFTVSYMDLNKATNGFSSTNIVGTGGFATVYKGTFDQEYVRLTLQYSDIKDGNRTAFAIKVFNLQRRGAARSFINECETLRNIHHGNLVKFISTCTSIDEEGKDFRAILYELMDHGSLDMWLHSTKREYHDRAVKPRILSLHARINIAIDVACALSYIHHECENCIIHCDLKPSNILLNKNMVAHVADFGLATILAESSNIHQSCSSIGLRGTTGYIAPEYGLGSKVTTKGDIYSFGILLLEMLTREKPTHRMFHGGLNLHGYVWIALPNRVMDITDPVVKKMASANNVDLNQMDECLTRMFNIGLSCSKPSQKDRPDMPAVLQELKSIRNIFQETQLHATSTLKD